MSKKILIVTDDSGESFEILYAVYRFREAGLIPVIAATKKKTLNGVIHDFAPGWNTYIEKPGYLINADIDRICTQAATFASDDHVDVEVRCSADSPKCILEKDNLSVTGQAGEEVLKGKLFQAVQADKSSWQVVGKGADQKVVAKLVKEAPMRWLMLVR